MIRTVVMMIVRRILIVKKDNTEKTQGASSIGRRSDALRALRVVLRYGVLGLRFWFKV